MNLSELEIWKTEDEIQEAVVSCAFELTQRFKDSSENVVFLCLLKGGVMFYSDLCKYCDIELLEMQFLTAKSYGSKMESTGDVKVIGTNELDVKDKHVVIIDDIFDTGLTMSDVARRLEHFQAKSITACTLFKKPFPKETWFDPSQVAKDLNLVYGIDAAETDFLIGYGLDLDQLYRNLHQVYRVDKTNL